MTHEAHTPESQRTPPPVDFDAIARHALDSGLFDPIPSAITHNKQEHNQYARLPTTLFDVPYIHGPQAIQRWQEDVSEQAMTTVRTNFVHIIWLVMPENQLMGYFHHRFASDTVASSRTMAKLVDQYHTKAVDGFLDRDFADPSLSFQIDGVNRKTKDRKLFTRDEIISAMELTIQNPAVALSVLAYEAVISDYLQEIKNALVRESHARGKPLTTIDLSLYDKFSDSWITANFTHSIIPAVALLYRIDLVKNGGKIPEINTTLFADAFNFIIDNGAFRNWIPVSADIATDHKARINHFLCPAVGSIRTQFNDGMILGHIHAAIRHKYESGDFVTTLYAKKIQMNARNVYDRRNQRMPTEEEILASIEEQRNITLHDQDQIYRIKLTDEITEGLYGEKHAADIVRIPPVGSHLYHTLESILQEALSQDVAIYFTFNEWKFRITPARARSLFGV